MFKHILVPVDGSEHSKIALQVASQLIASQGGTITLLHVPEPRDHEPLLVWGLGAVPSEASLEERDKAGKKLLEKAEEEARAMGLSDDTINTQLEHGEPRQAIVTAAKNMNVDAIVLGSRGLSDFKGMMVGSTSHSVSHDAECRVITVH